MSEDLKTTRNNISSQMSYLLDLVKAARRSKAPWMQLSRRGLTELPESVGELTHLRELYLADNRLRELPESIGNLAGLQLLDLSNNELEKLPDSIRNLKSLKVLYLHGNPALDLPQNILGSRGWHTVNPNVIINYYLRVREGHRPLNEAKLILVGRGGVGKTSMVNRLVYDHFEMDEKKTDGIRITDWKFRLQSNEDVRLNIWDFGGQEIMHATHQFFLTERSIYLLVLNGREGGEDADAEYWLKIIESFGDESPVIVVMNKIKEHPFDLNRRGLKQKYSAIQQFIKTDCKDKTGIDELNKAIKRESDRLEHLRDAFPASWFTIKDQLSEMKENYISFEEYRKLCKQHGEKDIAAQEALAGYLHNLGIVLNYKDDPRLQDTHVLNPHWVTNGIYKILNSSKLEEQRGEIRLNDLAHILDVNEYPVSMRRFIFDLMKKFELCFNFPDDDCHYLIPELLDKQEPEMAAEFGPLKCLNFQYHYPVLPEGLLPRFIVRTHTLSERLPRWRTGVILEFEGNRALVKADIQDKKVFINVAGAVSGRRRLLAIIRSDFERIHSDIRNLHPQEMVPLQRHPDIVVPYEKLLAMERAGVTSFPEVASNKVVELDVSDMLNGVDLEGTRLRKGNVHEYLNQVRLFFSYSHKDEKLRNELEVHLKLLQRQGLVEVWHDRKIESGDDWKRKIDENLERADIILLLVSADFISSDYCYEKEMKWALERHTSNEATVIPIIIRDTNLIDAPFAHLQMLPRDGKAVTTWPNKDSAWRDVSVGIKRIAESIRKRKEQLI